MRNVSLWRALLGVDKRTVIEDVELGDGGNEHAGAEVVIAHVRPRRGAGGRWADVGGRRRPTTGVRAGAAGEGWIGGRCGCGWRPTRRG